jgi:hypothetical protein
MSEKPIDYIDADQLSHIVKECGYGSLEDFTLCLLLQMTPPVWKRIIETNQTRYLTVEVVAHELRTFSDVWPTNDALFNVRLQIANEHAALGSSLGRLHRLLPYAISIAAEEQNRLEVLTASCEDVLKKFHLDRLADAVKDLSSLSRFDPEAIEKRLKAALQKVNTQGNQ